MKNKIIFILKYFALWIIFSVVARLIFIFTNLPEDDNIGIFEISKSFLYGLRMDFSLSGYVLLLSSLILCLSAIIPHKKMRNIFRYFTGFWLLLFSSIIISDIELFKAWGYHINSSVIEYLRTPADAAASVSTLKLIIMIISAIGISASIYSIFEFLIIRNLYYKKTKLYEIPLLILISGFMILPIRGSLDVAPMNTDFVFFSKKHFPNQAAINPIWNFIYEILHYSKYKRTYSFMTDKEALAIIDSLYHSSKQIEHKQNILKHKNPNVVLLLMESFTADGIGVLGGVKGITPNIDTLAQEGILFTNIYATGTRSDRGIASVISGFPAHPKISLLKRKDLLPYMPFLPKDFKKHGYSTSFYYAGDLNFAGFKTYTGSGFDKLITQEDFSGDAIKNKFKWGIHDEYMYQKLFDDIQSAKQPFFYMAFNMSSHEPFNVPGKKRVLGEDSKHLFMNSLAYTDFHLGRFIKKCKKSGVWDNTIFVIIADHSVGYIGNNSPESSLRYRIPFIITGGAIKQNRVINSKIGSQTDLSATLLSLFGASANDYKFSRNLFEEDSKFAFFGWANGVGVVYESNSYIYNTQSKSFTPNTPDNIKKYLKAYLQTLDISLTSFNVN